MPSKDFETEEPMELVGIVMPGDESTLDAMAECFIDEYVRLGWGETRLMGLFTNPMFLATHRVYRVKGEGYVRALIRKTVDKWHPHGR